MTGHLSEQLKCKNYYFIISISKAMDKSFFKLYVCHFKNRKTYLFCILGEFCLMDLLSFFFFFFLLFFFCLWKLLSFAFVGLLLLFLQTYWFTHALFIINILFILFFFLCIFLLVYSDICSLNQLHIHDMTAIIWMQC